MLVSFDIFDTALIRRCGNSQILFWLLARRLFPDDESWQDDFYLWRRTCEQRTRGQRLEEFYTGSHRLFPAYTDAQLLEAELQLESEELTANPTIRGEISRHREAGNRICFISDMYLPSRFLEQILRREGCLQGDEQVFVSCECQARKDTGEIFPLVRQKFPGLTSWLHYGDHPQSDGVMARKHHIATHLVFTGHTPLERRLRAHAHLCRNSLELPWLTGLARAARLLHGDTAEARLAANFLVPLYLPYVSWFLQRAKERGIRRIYFLARDGWILHQIALSLHPDMECRELFLSRKALMAPWLATHFTPQELMEVQEHHTLVGKKIRVLLEQLQLQPQQLEAWGVSVRTTQQLANRQEERVLLESLLQGVGAEPLRALCLERRERLLAYLKQEGFFDEDVPSAMVDIGWLGTTRKMLHDFLAEQGASPMHTFYFGIRRDVFPCSEGTYESYFHEGELSTELTTAVENFLSAAPYPSTTDYQFKGGKWIPQWQGEKAKQMPMAHQLQIHTCVAQTMAQMLANRTVSQEVLYLWAYQAQHELKALDVPLDLAPLTQLTDFDQIPFVRRLSFKEVVLCCLMGKHITAWDNASLMLTFGIRTKRFLWKLHQATSTWRSRLYKIRLKMQEKLSEDRSSC